MSSIQSSFAQNKTRRLVAFGTAPSYPLASITDNFVAGSVSNVGSVYTVDTLANFVTFVNDLQSDGTSGTYPIVKAVIGECYTDLGSEVVVGVAGNDSILLKFRAVKNTVSAASANGSFDGAKVGYVVVENNTFGAVTDPTMTNKLPVQVARV